MARHTRLPLLLIGFGGAWLLFGMLLAPPFIEEAYHSDGLPLFEALIAPHRAQPLSFFLEQWQTITILGFLACLALAGFAYLLLSPARSRRLVGRATPEALGAIRMLVCGILLVSTLWENLPSSAYLPREMLRPMGLVQFLYLIPGFEAFVASPTALGVFQGVTALVLFLGLIGWRTRVVLPLGAVCYLILGGLLRQYAWFYHTGLIPLYLLFVLSLLPAGDGWSVDRLLRLWKGKPVPPAAKPTMHYGWARYAVWTALALPYVMAGLSKLRNGGLFWWEATNFKHYLFQSALQPMAFDFDGALLLASAPDALFEALALTALLGELLYGLVLFFRWARRVFPALMMATHLGILFLQNILFFDLLLLQLLFFDFRPLRRAVALRLAARKGRIRLAYDGGAREHHVRVVRVLRALDLFERLHFTALQATASPAEQRSWRAVYRGKIYRGTALYRLLARAFPALWPFVPLFYLPGLPHLIDRLLSGKGVEAPRAPDAAVPESAEALRGGSPRLVLALSAVFLVCWVFRVEFYPFTGMQMFSTPRGPVVTYEVALAHFRSGDVGRAPIAKGLGAMADGRYRRLLKRTLDQEEDPLGAAFFESFAVQWNRKAPPEQAVEQVEVQRWQWDFRSEPGNPSYGRLVARKVFPVGAQPPSRGN